MSFVHNEPSTNFSFTEATLIGESSWRPTWRTRERASFPWSFVILAHLSPVTTRWRNPGRSWYSPLSNTANSSSCSWLFTNFSRVFTKVYSSNLAVPHSCFTQLWRTPFVRSDRLVVNLSGGQPRPALWRTGLITLRMNSSVSFEPNQEWKTFPFERDDDLTQSHAGLQTTKAICYCVMDGFSSYHFPCDNFQLISYAFPGTNIWCLFFLGIPMRHFRNGMLLATLEGVLYKTVSVQLSSMDCNEN